MANCGLLKNDGTSFFLLNAGGVLLLNDNTCGSEAGVSESALAATGAGTGTFTSATLTTLSAALAATGAGTGTFTSATLTTLSAALAATGTGSATFEGFPPAADVVAPPPQTGSGWADQLKARQRQERWEVDNRRMELLERKKTRISMEIGELRYELSQESHPARTRKLQGTLNTAMDAVMAIEDELQQLYSRMM
jgi:hypothetical protein